ncbi:hypothetical protein H9649_14170 [Sporosarcina sp. Sa2YVA2]|uniref:ParB/Sulfiredoxin domain-containing protein n=1 Tax=Sporosarcina quadrami TaxID=2762234 RepID=A0ABR8UCG4_9BACL|nr:hypothetical protein [Sporosarcina quadrami]MBD7985733.1 hypothetical protein [Sporosarcina quadrami]
MVVSKILYYEKESLKFNPFEHMQGRIQEMEQASSEGAEIAARWKQIVKQLKDEEYPVVHPSGRETFSLFAEFPSGVFDYALDIDGATSLINENQLESVIYQPSSIIESVDMGNVNTDTSNIKTNHKNPVMVLQSQYITEGKPYCINGNHRITEAFKKQAKQIGVFVFDDLEFVPFFYDLLSKAIYYLEIDYHNVVKNERRLLVDHQTAFAYEF